MILFALIARKAIKNMYKKEVLYEDIIFVTKI